MVVSPPDGLRARKKAETRDALRRAARTLFAEQGFRATSVEQIAEAANVSGRTFFRYFASKEDLLAPEIGDLFDSLESALAARPAAEPVLDAYRAALGDVMAGAPGGAFLHLAPGLDPTDPALAPVLLRAFVGWEERLAGLFADRLAGGGGDLPPGTRELQARVAAGVAIAATRAVARTIQAHGGVPPAAAPAELLDRAFAYARAGCGSTH